MARNITHAATAPWWAGEQPQIPIPQLPQHLPPRGTGKPISASRAYAYTTVGVRGVRLRRFRGPSGWVTTGPEVARFLQALTALAGEVA